MTKEPNPVDIRVGENIRLKRNLLGVSQSNLAEELGVTFQQVQKYEKGVNKIGASRLQQIADVLKVSPSFFFQNSPTIGKAAIEERRYADPELKAMMAFLETPDGRKLVGNFMRIEDPDLRVRIMDLVVGICNSRTATANHCESNGASNGGDFSRMSSVSNENEQASD